MYKVFGIEDVMCRVDKYFLTHTSLLPDKMFSCSYTTKLTNPLNVWNIIKSDKKEALLNISF